MPPVPAELDIVEMRQHLLRIILLGDMLVNVYQKIVASPPPQPSQQRSRNYVINDRVITRPTIVQLRDSVWHGRHEHFAGVLRHVRHSTHMTVALDTHKRRLCCGCLPKIVLENGSYDVYLYWKQ